MKLIVYLIVCVSQSWCILNIKASFSGIYEERIDTSRLKLDVKKFTIDIDSIIIYGEEDVSLKPVKLNLKDGIVFALCNFEDIKNSLNLLNGIEDVNVEKICKVFSLFFKDEIYGAKYRLKTCVNLVESSTNTLKLSVEVVNASFVGDTQKVKSESIDFLDSFLIDNGNNPRFNRLKEQYNMSFDEDFVYCIKMIKMCVERLDLQNIGLSESIERLKERFACDKQMKSPSQWDIIDDLEFMFFFERMGLFLCWTVNDEDFPFFSILFVSNSEERSLKIHRSLSFEIVKESEETCIKNYDFNLYDSRKRKVSSRMVKWFMFDDRICLCVDDILNNDVWYIGAVAKNGYEVSSLLELTPYIFSADMLK